MKPEEGEDDLISGLEAISLERRVSTPTLAKKGPLTSVSPPARLHPQPQTGRFHPSAASVLFPLLVSTMCNAVDLLHVSYRSFAKHSSRFFDDKADQPSTANVLPAEERH